MGDRMTPIPFSRLLEWVFQEKRKENSVFGITDPYIKKCEENCRGGAPYPPDADKEGKTLKLFGEKLETPFGPAAGPHTQLAQNIIAAYYSGNRFFELKTVQILDGEDLPVSKPCILAEDEGYNCEWSTELRVPDAFDEYVKAYLILKVISKEWGIGDSDGFIFNMSVGYDLKGIKSEKIDRFIDGLMDASETPTWKECIESLLSSAGDFEKVDRDFIMGISPRVCSSATISTLHGCPPEEIESIASYLLKEKHLNTFVKCNPTLLGYEEAKRLMNLMGYDYVAFGDFHFKDDLQMEDAIPMLGRLMQLAEGLSLEFGVKLTNTFPVDVNENQLPSQEMYMSGRPLSILSLSVALKLSEAFDGRLRISYSGGADYFNIERIFDAGIWPITMATYFLKPGGLKRGRQIAQMLDSQEYKDFDRVDIQKLKELISDTLEDKHYQKGACSENTRKLKKTVPLWDCFTSPCSEQCPINQDVPTYVKLVGEGKYLEALRVITSKNPLPFITGTICSHTCMSKCMRGFYEGPVSIRNVKLIAAENGFKELIEELKPSDRLKGKKVAVVGGGPAGIASSFFLAREGASVTVFEKKDTIGGVITNVVPEFRIASERVNNDVELARRLGVQFITNRNIENLNELREEGYEEIILAVGAYNPQGLGIPCENEMNAIDFLERCRKSPESINAGSAVAVIGAGNTAMDAARAALRLQGVEKVYLVYRRTRRYMPADEEELELALKEGVIFKELLAPEAHRNGTLVCRQMELGEPDASGRRRPVPTGKTEEIPVNLVVASFGEKVDGSFYSTLGLAVDEKGAPVLKSETMESTIKGVYVVGDGAKGPATVVEAIRDARKAADAIGCVEGREPVTIEGGFERSVSKRGIILETNCYENEDKRCLECGSFCGACTEVCPNRANVLIHADGFKMPQILHIDYMCNECGNCKSFCPYDSSPYKDKLTLFSTKADFENSENQGFLVTDKDSGKFKARLDGKVSELSTSDGSTIARFVSTIIKDYPYFLNK